ncbi:hypothetical protein EI94DRAFT_1813461 [Lactarius quietus]|nr:hypothetical protein EI94DRAFT_1813461 [Lactarius quietus]
MASNIPMHRVTRMTRTAVLKDKNADARSRIITCSKPPSSSNANAQSALTNCSTVSTLSTHPRAVVAKDSHPEDPNVQGKHKRSTLGEVTVNKPKSHTSVVDKGKGKEDAAPIPPGSLLVSAPAAHPDPAPKPATCSPATVNHVVNGIKEGKPALQVDAMVIDLPDLHVPHPPCHVNATPAPLLAVSTPLHKPSLHFLPCHCYPTECPHPGPGQVWDIAKMASNIPTKTPILSHRHSLKTPLSSNANAQSALTTRSTISTLSTRPNGAEWEYPDSEDGEDPMMVSEYMNEIFEYLKVVEQITLPNSNYMNSQ